MKFLVLNLPYSKNIIRKYSCSYIANGFLYPPIELLRVATILKENLHSDHKVFFRDAIEEKLDYKKCLSELKHLAPDIIVTLASVDFINEEREFFLELKKHVSAKIILIGYIPSLYPERFAFADEILGSNFEPVIYAACKSSPEAVNIFLSNISKNKKQKLSFNADLIRKVDFSYIADKKYSELFAKGKTAFTYFSFGCPYKCSFCIRTYNLSEVHYRSIDNIISELQEYKGLGIKNIRILDDNCTLNKKLLYAIIKFQNDNNCSFNYYGLSRIDLLDEETVDLLIKLNFKSLLIGIEAISSKTQNSYNKNLNIEIGPIYPILKKLKDNGVIVSMFIMINPLTDEKKDIYDTLKFLNNLPINFSSFAHIVPYPGTDFFNKNIENIDFQESPNLYYRIKPEYLEKFKKQEISFILRFYLLKPQRVISLIKMFFMYPLQMLRVFKNFVRFTFKKDKVRDNFF